MTGQLALFAAPTTEISVVQMHRSPVHRWVPGDRRAAARLDPGGDRGLEDGNAEVIRWGWGRPVTDLRIALAAVL